MTKPANPKARTFTLIAKAKDESERKAIQYFKEVCRRDGLELRKEIINLISLEWVQKHPKPGNPQKQLFQFDGSKQSRGLCEWEGCHNKAEFLCVSAFPYGKDKRYCSFHRKRAEFKRDISQAKKLK